MRDNTELEVAGTPVPIGARMDLLVTVSESYVGERLNLPITVINGTEPGPTMFVTAAVHADELNGIAIVRELLATVEPADIHGALICVPVVNVLGLPLQSRYLPDRRDLNRSFPGSSEGSMAARLAHTLATEVIDGADCGVDLHTATQGRANLPQIRARMDHEHIVELARVFGAPMMVDAPLRPGSLREAGHEMGVPVLTYEGGEALRFEDDVIQTGLRGIRRLMGHLSMNGRREDLDALEVVESDETHWVRADRGGIMTLEVSLGDVVEVGQPLWTVNSPFGRERNTQLSRYAGTIIGLTTVPLVNPGDAVLHVAVHGRLGLGTFDDSADVEVESRMR